MMNEWRHSSLGNAAHWLGLPVWTDTVLEFLDPGFFPLLLSQSSSCHCRHHHHHLYSSNNSCWLNGNLQKFHDLVSFKSHNNPVRSVIPIPQTRKLRPREGEWLVQGHKDLRLEVLLLAFLKLIDLTCTQHPLCARHLKLAAWLLSPYRWVGRTDMQVKTIIITLHSKCCPGKLQRRWLFLLLGAIVWRASPVHYFLSLWLWASYCTSLGFNFFICKMGIMIIISLSYNHCGDNRDNVCICTMSGTSKHLVNYSWFFITVT